MGQYAEDILNGDVDEQTGEWLGEGQGFPRTIERRNYNQDWDKKNFAKGTRAIRKELAILINAKKKEFPDQNENNIVNQCRKTINDKYSKGWREQF